MLYRIIAAAILTGVTYASPNAAAEKYVETGIPFLFDGKIVSQRIDKIVIDEGVPSISIASVMGDGEIWAYASGLAEKETSRPATPDTLYRLASVSKPITAVAIMLLVERGLIRLDEPANKYLGDQKIIADMGSADEVTVRRLMAHRGGLPLHYNLIHADENYQRRSLDETIARYGRAMLPPGLTHRYSNVGYGVLERIIEIQSGKAYEAFLYEEIFKPLGMNSAGVITTTVHPEGAAIPYTRGGDRYAAYDMDTRGAGGIYMTASDLVKFGRFFSDSLDGKSKLLTQQSALKMLETQATSDEGKREWYVLGWVHELRGEKRQYDTIYHLGSTPGVRAELWIYPDADLVIATLVNEMSWSPLKRAREAVVAAVLPELAFIPYPSIVIDSKLQKRWVGTIDLGVDGTLPLVIDFSIPLKPKILIANKTVDVLSTRQVDDGFIQVKTSSAPLPTEDSRRQAYSLSFLMKQEDEMLAGYMSVDRIATRDRDSGNFAFPVSMNADISAPENFN